MKRSKTEAIETRGSLVGVEKRGWGLLSEFITYDGLQNPAENVSSSSLNSSNILKLF